MADKLTNTRMVRIEWGDCDPAGIIFYPRYFAIFDASTAALFERALGMTKYQYLAAHDFAGFPVVTNTARFLKPIRFGDDVAVESTIAFGKSSFSVGHKVTLNGELCATGSEKRVWTARDAQGTIKSREIPAQVLAKFN
jgi:4-hydroxybenzoyl-CoA thioesterase